jgi:hypothetical protein
MRNRGQARLTLAILLAAGAVCMQGSAQPAAKAATTCGGCANCQSPRHLPPSMPTGGASMVQPGPDDATILYTSGGNAPVPLVRCSQHYHCRIENPQGMGCPTQTGPGPEICPLLPPVDSWVEVHTVYAPQVTRDCQGNYESTDCCGGDPKVVLAYQAKVTAGVPTGPVPVYWGPVPGPLPVFWGSNAAEWSGSTTGPPKPTDPPNGCKPAALWSFALACNFTLSQRQFALFRHPEPARGVQPPDRLSDDLRRITRQ